MWGKRDLCERKTKEDDESDSGDVVLAAGEEEQNHMREGEGSAIYSRRNVHK